MTVHGDSPYPTREEKEMGEKGRGRVELRNEYFVPGSGISFTWALFESPLCKTPAEMLGPGRGGERERVRKWLVFLVGSDP